jgi:hypothetical protein
MKRTIPIAATVIVVWLLGGTVTVQAEVSAWTGCVTRGGSIIHLARGDHPKESCLGNQTLVHLRDEAAFQNADANYKQGAICDAFHELTLSPAALAKLGCSSHPDLTRPGTVERVFGPSLVANNFDVCGILKAETSDTWAPSYQWVVPGGFVVSTTALPIEGPSADACKQLCVGDDKCVAAFLKAEHNYDTRVCRIFHYSDASGDWNHFCGYSPGFENQFSCAERLDDIDDNWWVRVPDGQTVHSCPGADPTP